MDSLKIWKPPSTIEQIHLSSVHNGQIDRSRLHLIGKIGRHTIKLRHVEILLIEVKDQMNPGIRNN